MSGRRRVAILDRTHLVEDYLDAVGLTFDEYRDELDDGWLFGYVRALDRLGVDATIVVVSATTRTTTRITHGPTGAPIVVLPAPSSYRAVPRRVPNPYAATVEQAATAIGVRADGGSRPPPGRSPRTWRPPWSSWGRSSGRTGSTRSSVRTMSTRASTWSS